MRLNTIIKILSIISIIGVIANLLLFAFGVYSALTFWMIIIAFAIIAFPVLGYLRKKATATRHAKPVKNVKKRQK